MLTIENISVTFHKGSPDEKKLFNNFSFHVNKGDFITIIGSNGAGKSTMFNCVCGDVETESGRILLEGQDITLMPTHQRARSIGRLFQDPQFGTSPNMTIEENLALSSGKGGWLSHITNREKKEFRERLAELNLGLEDRMHVRVKNLSGGLRQALTLIMATYNPPKLLLLDEHTAALDPSAAEKILAVTKKIVEEDKLTCLMITHNMNQALEFGNRTIMMNSGKIVFDTSGEERAKLTVPDLLVTFKNAVGSSLATDRILLSENE